MTLYELNKAGYKSIPAMKDSEIRKMLPKLHTFLTSNEGKYYMLLNNEKHYFTLFTYADFPKPSVLIDEIIDVVKNLGTIKDIEIKSDVIEFWVEDYAGCFVYLFFNYDGGVIEI